MIKELKKDLEESNLSVSEWKKDQELGELIGKFYPPEPPLVPNLDTSTEEGRRWKLHTFRVQDEKAYLENMTRKYKETGDKRYAVQINNVLGNADNIPQDDK